MIPTTSGGGNGMFWRGQDNKVYVAGDQGTNSAGVWDDNTSDYWMSRGYSLGADPNPVGSTLGESTNAPTNPNGGTAVKAPVLNQAAVNATNNTLASLSTILAQALGAADTGYANANDALKQQETQERGRYDESTIGNMQNYDANLAASLRAGRSGLSGLTAALRGGGGGGNDFANKWVKNTVADTASNDIREGFNTYDENRGELDNSLSTLLTGLEGKRRQNEDALANNKRAAQLYDAQQRQSLSQTLAGLYSEGGRSGEAANYLAQAGSYAPTIAQNMGSQVSRYDSAPVKVDSPDVTAFTAPEQQDMTAAPNVNTGVFSLSDPRRKKEAPVGA